MRVCQQYFGPQKSFFWFVHKLTEAQYPTEHLFNQCTIRMWFWVDFKLDNNFGGKVGSLATWGPKLSRSMLLKFEIRTCLLRIHQQKQIFFFYCYGQNGDIHLLHSIIQNLYIIIELEYCHQAFWSTIPFYSNLDLCDE